MPGCRHMDIASSSARIDCAIKIERHSPLLFGFSLWLQWVFSLWLYIAGGQNIVCCLSPASAAGGAGGRNVSSAFPRPSYLTGLDNSPLVESWIEVVHY